MISYHQLASDLCGSCNKRGVNRGMQIRRSVLFFGPIRRSDVIFAQIRIPVTKVLLLRDLGVQRFSQQLRKFYDRSHRDRVGI